MRWPSGLNATEKAWSSWPARVRSSTPVSAFQTLAVWSSLAVTMRWPSGLKAAELTDSVITAMPARVRSSSPVAAFQTLAVLSSLAVTMRWPSGLKATELTDLGVVAAGEIHHPPPPPPPPPALGMVQRHSGATSCKVRCWVKTSGRGHKHRTSLSVITIRPATGRTPKPHRCPSTEPRSRPPG